MKVSKIIFLSKLWCNSSCYYVWGMNYLNIIGLPYNVIFLSDQCLDFLYQITCRSFTLFSYQTCYQIRLLNFLSDWLSDQIKNWSIWLNDPLIRLICWVLGTGEWHSGYRAWWPTALCSLTWWSTALWPLGIMAIFLIDLKGGWWCNSLQ